MLNSRIHKAAASNLFRQALRHLSILLIHSFGCGHGSSSYVPVRCYSIAISTLKNINSGEIV